MEIMYGPCQENIMINIEKNFDNVMSLNISMWPELCVEDINRISIIEDLLNIATEDSEVDPAAILFTFLSGFGAMVGSDPHIKIGDTCHPARINAVLVGASSRARKGTSEKPVRRILKCAEEYAEIQPLNISPGPLSSSEGLIYAVRDANESGKELDLGVQDKRLWCIEQEFASVFKAGKRDGNTLSCTIRTAWDGGTISPLTKHNKICATDPHISILGHITQEELRFVLNSTEIWNGFANRFLWVCVQRKKLVPLPRPIDDVVMQAMGMELGKILLSARSLSELRLTPSATEFWKEEYPTLTTDFPGKYGVITSRAEAYTLRLALACALIDGAVSIDLHHLRAAIAMWWYCNDSAKFLFGNMDSDSDSDKILIALDEGPMTTTELHGLFSGHKNGRELDTMLSKLQMEGKIIGKQPYTSHKRGKPTTIWSSITR